MMAQASSLVPLNQKCGQKIQKILNISSANRLWENSQWFY